MKFNLGLRNLPFNPDPSQVIYVENEYDEAVNHFILNNYDALRKGFRQKGFEILLPDYNQEIALNPICRAFYLLFLKHPEGIDFKLLPDYKDELLSLYKRTKADFFSFKAIDSVEKIVRYDDNYKNETRSKINNVIRRHFDEQISKFYTIEGKKGEPKRITLPPEMITWEK